MSVPSLESLLDQHRDVFNADKKRVYCTCNEWAAFVETVQQADRAHAEHQADVIREHHEVVELPGEHDPDEPKNHPEFWGPYTTFLVIQETGVVLNCESGETMVPEDARAEAAALLAAARLADEAEVQQ